MAAADGYPGRCWTSSSAASGPDRGDKLAARMADATYAYERERYQDARRILRVLVDEVPGSAAVRELYGLVLYRTGQWAQAARQLEAYRELSGSFDQHPVLADCYRALRRWDDVEAIWASSARRRRAPIWWPRAGSWRPAPAPIREIWPAR